MVRLAQDFSMSLPLLDEGNFGSMDGDPPAAMRYTEIRLGKVANTLLEDIDKDTVNFVDNYDTTLTEQRFCHKVSQLISKWIWRYGCEPWLNIPPLVEK